MERDTDVEKGRAEEVSDECCALEDIEKSTMRYRKEAGKSTESKNLLPKEDDPKVIEKRGLGTGISELLPGSVDVPESNPGTSLIGSTAIRSSSARAPKQSNLHRYFDDSEIVQRFPGAEVQSTSDSSTSSGDSTTRQHLAECEVAFRKALEGAEIGKSAGCKCRMLKLTMEVAVEAIQKQVDAFSRKARSESHRGEISPYFTLAEKHSAYVRSLRKKVERLEQAAISAEESSLRAYDAAVCLSKVTNDGKEWKPQAREAMSDAFSSKEAADATCLMAYKVEHSALRVMKTVLAGLKNTADELENNSLNSSVPNQQCENRERRTRVAHVAAVFVGAGVLASLPLFDVGSDSFYAVLCLGVVILGWAVIYWSHELYVKCCRTETVSKTAEGILKQEYLDHIDERWEYLQDYLLSRNVSLTPSSSDTDADSWQTADTAPAGE